MMFQRPIPYYSFLLLFTLITPCISLENVWLKGESGPEGRYGNYGQSIVFARPDKLIVTSNSKDTIVSNSYLSKVNKVISVYDTSGNLHLKNRAENLKDAKFDSSGFLVLLASNRITRCLPNGIVEDTLTATSGTMYECFDVTKFFYFIGGYPSVSDTTNSTAKNDIRTYSIIKQFDYQLVQKNEIQFKCRGKGYCFLEKISASETTITCSGLFGRIGDTLWVGDSILVAQGINQDRFLVQFDINGHVKMNLQFANNVTDLTMGTASEPRDGSLYVCGGFEGTFNAGNCLLQSNGGEDAFVLKIQRSGKIEWVKTWGSNIYDDHCSAISVFDSQIWITGIAAESFSGEQKSEQGKISMVSFDTSGVVLHDVLLEGNSRGEGCGITLSKDQVFITGYFSGELKAGKDTLITNINEYNFLLGAFKYENNVTNQMFALTSHQPCQIKQTMRTRSATYDLRGRLIKNVEYLNQSNLTMNNLRNITTDQATQVLVRRK